MCIINDLPIELYELIFKNLSIDDLFNCRLINKKFKYSTYNCVYKLVVTESILLSNNWNYNNELINLDDIIGFECFKTIKKLSIFNLGVSLKYLRIDFLFIKSNKELDEVVSNLNNLINLNCLEIDYYTNYRLEINLINLKYLKYFTVYDYSIINYFELITPKLERIQFNYLNNIYIKSNLDSIKHFITNSYDDQLIQFKNLEIIEFRCVNESNFNENLLSFFKNLKQLKIDYVKEIGFELKNRLIKLLNNGKELKQDIDIYLGGVKIINIEKLNEIESYKTIIEYQIKNYDLLDLNLPRIESLEYSELNNCFINLRNDLPSSFFNKFQNILSVHIIKNIVHKPIDLNHLIWFLNNLKCLNLIFIVDLLDQNLFNNLPKTIKYLIISNLRYGYQTLEYLIINFDFILRIDKLIKFSINHINIDLFDLVARSFLNLKYLIEFDFEFKMNKIFIQKINKKFKLSCLNLNTNLETNSISLDYDQLIRRLIEIRYED